METSKEPEEKTQVVKPAKQKQKWSLKKKIAVIVGAIVIFIIGMFIFATAATSAPLKISDELLTDIKALNSTAAYNLLSSGAKEVTSPDDLKTAIDQIGPILTGVTEVQSKEVKAATDAASTATIIYNINGNDNIKYNFTVNLVEENKEWKVLNFESKKQ